MGVPRLGKPVSHFLRGLPMQPQLSTQLDTPANLLQALSGIRADVLRGAQVHLQHWQPDYAPSRQHFAASVKNLAHYLAFRERDMRQVQMALRPWGLSSLGRLEAQVLPNLNAVLATLAQLASAPTADYPNHPSPDDFQLGNRLLAQEATAVLGQSPPHRPVRMMVTIPSEAADDPQIARDMIAHGMNIARINCSHDDPDRWQRMIGHIRAAAADAEQEIKIAMDLSGPKARTADTTGDDEFRVRPGELILLTEDVPGEQDARYAAQVRCTLPQVLAQVQVGAAVWFDDGRFGTTMRERVPQGIVLEVTDARPKGEKLKDEKGINFPDTDIDLPALTDKDRQDLDFVATYADIVQYSFVQTADDVRSLQHELETRNPGRALPLVLKVETRRGVRNLPELIVAAGSKQPVGVMIARGDLAIELSFVRLAEMQEEIMWICEAAHVPVVWATQVLETLAKKRRPSRAEITDAATAQRAECVMLNKGDYILNAMDILNDVLQRMGGHQSKKMPQLRALRSWERDEP